MVGYTRQSAAEIAPGEDIAADALSDEFDAIASAMSGASGHGHTGGTGDGPKINLTTSVSGILPAANGGTGLTSISSFATLTGTQSLTNKTIVDPFITDNSDVTKKIDFNLSGITTATTRTFVFPNFDGTLATLAGTETLTNKTVTGGTIWTLPASTLVSGDILYATAANTLVRLPKGTDGQVLTLASGVPSWATPTVPDSGDYDYIGTYTASAASEFVISAPFSSTYDTYIFDFGTTYSSASGSNSTFLSMEISVDGGSNYLSGSYNDNGIYVSGSTVASVGALGTGLSVFRVFRGLGNSSNPITGGSLKIQLTSTLFTVNGILTGLDYSSEARTVTMGGFRSTSSKVNAVRFTTGANITGSIKVYGVKST